MPARHLLALLGKALVAHAWLGGTSAPSLPPPPQPPPDCWFMGKKVEPELCILPPPPVPSPPPPPPPTPFLPPQNSTGYLPETGDDLHARNVMYVGGCVSALAVTGMVGAYAYSQVDEPTSTAGAAARSFKAAVTGRLADPVKGGVPKSNPKEVYASLPHQPRAKEPGGAYQKLAEDQMEPGGAAA
mmetsp:Transcript_9777/g.29110  ORF Transcript_9777/g.29110 Transcript_9777/m.29110 type:complete len:186 (+) Transcript_9777:78-635(+)